MPASQHSATPEQSPFGAFPVAPTHRWLVAATRWLPTRGIGKSLAHLLRRLFILSHRKIVDDVVDGMRLRVHLQGNVCERRYFFTPRLFDRAEREFIRTALPAGGRFVDVGANVGLYSLWAGAAAGPNGRVLALEPNPAALERLRTNIQSNGFTDRIDVLPVAAGDVDGELELWLDPSNLGGSSLRRSDGRRAVRVPVRPLLAIVLEAGLTGIDIMKLDIEGYEDAVLLPFLRDAPATLLPGAIIIEDSRERWQSDLIARLEATGYRIHQRSRMNLVLARDVAVAASKPAPPADVAVQR